MELRLITKAHVNVIKASSLLLVMMLFYFTNFVGQSEITAQDGELLSGFIFVFTYYPFVLLLPAPFGLSVYLALMCFFLYRLGEKSHKSYWFSCSLSLVVFLVMLLDLALGSLGQVRSDLSAIGIIVLGSRPISSPSILVIIIFLISSIQILNIKKKPLVNAVTAMFSGYALFVHLFLLN